jgi:hypothetical protein
MPILLAELCTVLDSPERFGIYLWKKPDPFCEEEFLGCFRQALEILETRVGRDLGQIAKP